jgi:uncharacterized RDD family membrane protein YckC
VRYNATMRWREIKQQKQRKTLDSGPRVIYAGFWSRALGFMTDLFMIGMPVSLVMMVLFGYDAMHSAGGMDVLLQTEAAQSQPPSPMMSISQILLSLVIYVAFWRISMQTPGKKMAGTKVVDATTFQRASWLQLIVRFLGYFLSAITLVGFFIGLMRKDKRALHDLISHTAIIHA